MKIFGRPLRSNGGTGILVSLAFHGALLGLLAFSARAGDSRHFMIAPTLLPERLSSENRRVDLEDDAEPVGRPKSDTNSIAVATPPTEAARPSSSEFDASRFASLLSVDEAPAPDAPICPEYPAAARRLGIEGRVLMMVYIDERGRVKRCEVVKPADPLLARASLEAMEKAVFRPARVKGVARPVAIQIPIRFKLHAR